MELPVVRSQLALALADSAATCVGFGSGEGKEGSAKYAKHDELGIFSADRRTYQIGAYLCRLQIDKPFPIVFDRLL